MVKHSTGNSIISFTSSFRSTIHDNETEQRQKLFATSSTIQRIIDKVNRQSPINLRLLTVPICKASVKRIASLEALYAQSRLFRYLLRKGLPPTLLFLSTTATFAWLLRRFYIRHHYLALNSLGVFYPTWRCWCLVKQLDTNGQTLEQLGECKSWLTYWMLYGSFQVLDNWHSDLLLLFPNYNLYKLLVLYWAQSPHSKGANMLYRYVLQKPEDEEMDNKQCRIIDYASVTQHEEEKPAIQYLPSSTTPRRYESLLTDNCDELTLTIGHNESADQIAIQNQEGGVRSFRILDGYTPPTLSHNEQVSAYECGASNSSNSGRSSSSGSSNGSINSSTGVNESKDYSSSVGNGDLNMPIDHQQQQQQKQVYPMLVSMEAEAAW